MAFERRAVCSYFTQDLSPFSPKFEVLRLRLRIRLRDGRVFGIIRRYDCGYHARPHDVPDLMVVYLGPRNPN